MSDNELWAFGGYDGTTLIREINVFDLSVDPIVLKRTFTIPTTHRYWRSGTSIHVRKDLNKLFVLGGETGGTVDLPVLIVNTNTGTVSTGPNTVKRNYNAVMIDNEIWLLGGSNSTTATIALDTIQKYNVITNTLTTESVKLAPPRGSNGSTVIGNLIYMMGGYTDYDSRHSGTRVPDKGRIVSFNTITKEFKPLVSIGRPPDYLHASQIYSLQTVNGDLYWLDGSNFYKGVLF